MEEPKRLDLDAPLLSVRPRPTLHKTPSKSYNSKTPGVVPFNWEQTPGQPKPPLLLPSPSFLKEIEPSNSLDGNDSDEVESLFCGSPDEMGGSFEKDPEFLEFMIDRFLPAAKAMATGHIQSATWKKRAPPPPAEEFHERSGIVFNQYKDNVIDKYDYGSYVADEEEEEEEEEFYDDLPSKACGWIPRFCLKNSFLLLNPVPGMKVRSRLPLPPLSKISTGIKNADDEYSWEAVYKYKVGFEECPLREDASKLTSESNRLTYWTDSQTPDDSSPCHRSTGSAVSPYRSEAYQSPFHEGKGFLGVPKRGKGSSFSSCESIGENSWGVTPNYGKQGGDCGSPLIDETRNVDSVHIVSTPNSKSSSIDASDKSYERNEESYNVEACTGDQFQPRYSEISVPGFSSGSERSNAEEKSENACGKHGSNDGPEALIVEAQQKSDDSLALSLLPLPLPLPKSPSESWLKRTLPSVSSKNPSSQSFLGIQFQHKRQASLLSYGSKAFKAHSQQTQVIEKSSMPHSEA